MKTTPSIGFGRLAATLLLAAALAAGCNRGRRASGGGRSHQTPKVTMDGKFDEWPANTAAMADADWMYFRVTVEDGSAPIQASTDTLCLCLDADANSGTGQVMTMPAPAAGMGVDAVIEYSPQDPANPGQTQSGAAVYALDSAGNKVPLTHAQIGLASLPTYASSGYEVRMSRHVDAAAAPALSKELAAQGSARVMFVLKNQAGKIVGWSDPETVNKPAASKSAPRADLTVPTKPAGTVRVVSYNVLKSKLGKEPQTFARVFQVLKPDVILAQEWDADAATATAWFSAIVTGAHPWHARAAAGDVVIISPYPLTPLGPDNLALQSGTGGDEKDPAIRFVGAVAQTPAGPIAVGSMHLKCCGTAGSVEDKTRAAQATAINAAMKQALASGGARVRVFGGDLNLVGSHIPLDMLAAGLDAEGSNLTPAEPRILGDGAQFTWADAKQPFPPGRLDYLLYSDASADVVQSFVLDTSTLSPSALAKMGLDAGDTDASDHLPVVIDVKPR